MHVLNIEDDAIKHRDICRVLENCGITEIDWAKNLEDGIARLQQPDNQSKSYDLIITDMFYPLAPGGRETEAGEILIKKVKQMNLNIPIILCSSINYRIPEILGTVHYMNHVDWENDLRELINKI